jgi:hypothetical protein
MIGCYGRSSSPQPGKLHSKPYSNFECAADSWYWVTKRLVGYMGCLYMRTVASIKVRRSPVTRESPYLIFTQSQGGWYAVFEPSPRCFRMVTSVAYFRVIDSEVLYPSKLYTARNNKRSHSPSFTTRRLAAKKFPTRPHYQPCTGKLHHYTSHCHPSPRPLFPERHFWGTVRTLTLPTVHNLLLPVTITTTPSFQRPLRVHTSTRQVNESQL